MTEMGNQASPDQELVPENSAFPPGCVTHKMTHKRSEKPLPGVVRERERGDGRERECESDRQTQTHRNKGEGEREGQASKNLSSSSLSRGQVCVGQAGLELRSACLCLLSAGIHPTSF